MLPFLGATVVISGKTDRFLITISINNLFGTNLPPGVTPLWKRGDRGDFPAAIKGKSP
jgi:hypothetical protein